MKLGLLSLLVQNANAVAHLNASETLRGKQCCKGATLNQVSITGYSEHTLS